MSPRRTNRNTQRRNQKPWLGIIGAIAALLAGIGALLASLFGDTGIWGPIKQVTSKPCDLSTFTTQNYIKAEEAFFQEFESSKPPNSLNLWKKNGTPRSLEEILVSQSKELSSLREAIKRRLLYSPKRLIFIFGSAGSGKSAITSHLADVGNSVALIDLSKLRYNSYENKIHPMTQLVTDLKIGEIEVSKMADLLPKEKKKEFIQLLTNVAGKDIEDKTSIVIDGLDELHPYSSTHILSLAREYLAKNPQKNIVFVGRGEAFRGYIDKYNDNALHKAIYVKPLYLNKPELLRWYIAEFLAYPYLQENPDYVPNPKEVEKRFKQVTDVVNKKPELRHFLQTTEPANTLLRNLRYDQNVDELSRLQFLDLIKRNRKTHNRPSPEKSDVWLLYQQFLIQAARRLKPEKRPDGMFTAIVKPTERISVLHNERCLSVELSQVLDRSGVASLNPFNQNQLEYIFQPGTIQKFMAEQDSFSGGEEK